MSPTNLLACCEHCGCEPEHRGGHDDSCFHGCNDVELDFDRKVKVIITRVDGSVKEMVREVDSHGVLHLQCVDLQAGDGLEIIGPRLTLDLEA